MTTPRVSSAGGWEALRYTLARAKDVGGVRALYRRLRAKNACKTCALGMGGQAGGMVDESGHFPSVCKKSVQAQVADMQPALTEEFFATHSLETLAATDSRQLELFGRLGFPVIAEPGASHFEPLPWEEALGRAGEAIRGAGPERFFFYGSGRASNEAAFLAQLVVRAFGSANIHNCSYYCHQASGVALNQVYGSGTASVVLEDLARTDLALLIGANPPSNHPRLMTQLMKLRARGGKVIVVNPLRELGLERFRIPSDWRSLLFGSRMNDLFLQPRAGEDIALLKAILRVVMDEGGVDTDFVAGHGEGWERVAADMEDVDVGAMAARSGVAVADIERAARLISGAKTGIAMWAMGLTHHQHGVDNILALANLVLARGWFGKPGAGFLPIRGHSNVQGVGSMGVTPALRHRFTEALEERYDIRVPPDPGQDTYASMLAAEAGEIDAALLLGGNLFGSNPDAAWAERSLNNIGTVVHVSTKLNTGHLLGRGKVAIILPTLTRDEEPQITTQESMFNLVRISNGGAPCLGQARSEVEILAELAQRILPEDRFDWSELRSHEHLRQAIGSIVPGYAASKGIGSEGRREGEFQIDGRTFHEPATARPSQRVTFAVTPLPDASGDGAFRLMTLRSEGQFNTVVYEDEDLYRGVSRRDVVLMAAKDAAELGVAEGDSVVVRTAAGEMTVAVAISDISRGSLAMYYPEANVLVPQVIDPRSKTPAYKGVSAHVRPTNGP